MSERLEILTKFLCIIILMMSLIFIGVLLNNRELFSNLMGYTKEFWNDYGMYLAHPTNLFSVETQVPLNIRLLQQPTKCFSCERDLQRRYGLNPGFMYLANPTKCFSCERQFL